MSKVEIKLDHGGFAELLKSAEVAAMVGAFAEQVAGTVRSLTPAGTPVHVDRYVTDRAAAAVVIADPLGKMYQVRNGVLTKSAAAHGAEVKVK